jgi:hypothetical protein
MGSLHSVNRVKDDNERSIVRERIMHVYRQHNPRKVADIDGLLDEWQGEERLLLAKIEHKYGDARPAVALISAPSGKVGDKETSRKGKKGKG